MNYFKVLEMTPDCFLGFARRSPAILRLEAWIVKVTVTLRSASLLLLVMALACFSGFASTDEPMLTTALTVSAVAMQMIAYVLCMWLIYRLSKQASSREFDWCEDRFRAIHMPAPYKHMNRYVLASYVDAEVKCRLRQQTSAHPTEIEG